MSECRSFSNQRIRNEDTESEERMGGGGNRAGAPSTSSRRARRSESMRKDRDNTLSNRPRCTLKVHKPYTYIARVFRRRCGGFAAGNTFRILYALRDGKQEESKKKAEGKWN